MMNWPMDLLPGKSLWRFLISEVVLDHSQKGCVWGERVGNKDKSYD